jgi:hypothetical protein
MARMAGNMGAILAVGLLGCTRTCRMVRASRTVGLNRANRTVCTDRGQIGPRWPTHAGLAKATRQAAIAESGTCGRNSAGRKYWRPSWPVS